jgi:hypothetical protein
MLEDTGAYTRTDPNWQQQQQQQADSSVCDECAKRCTRRKIVISFLVQAGIRIAHIVKGIFS